MQRGVHPAPAGPRARHIPDSASLYSLETPRPPNNQQVEFLQTNFLSFMSHLEQPSPSWPYLRGSSSPRGSSMGGGGKGPTDKP